MVKGLFMTALAMAVAIGAGYADQSKSTVVIPVKPTTPISGKQMYVNYCAPCHGLDAKGRGPVAPALKQQPVDLTVLSRNHGGTFPAMHINSVLEYGPTIPSHGTAQMPVWGPIFGNIDRDHPGERAFRVNNLRHYLETIQVK
jgi:mono/diheme cytochrome c family protein